MKEAEKIEKKDIENTMTEGQPWVQIILFAIPLLIGNFLQQLYNTADSIVVGRFVSTDALAAVGSSNSLINLIIGMFTGIATGAGVIIAQLHGAKEDKKLNQAVHTAIKISIIGGLFLIVLGYFSSHQLLIWMGTPKNVIGSATIYLKVFFLGSLFNLIYNMGAGILRAVGNSKSPLYSLFISTFVNIIFLILFVILLDMGVAGAGLSTILAQGVSAVLVMRKLVHSKGPYRVSPKELYINRKIFKKIVNMGIPSGIQNSIVSLSNVIVQSNINKFGNLVMAGCSSYMKIDGFVILPVISFSMAIMTFIGQNVGAGKYDRIKKGLIATSVISCIYVAVVSVILLGFGRQILSIFTKETVVIQNGLIMLNILIPFYIIITLVNVFTGAFRGAGKSAVSMFIMVLNLCAVRMLWVNIATPMFPNIKTVLYGYPISWITGLVCVIIYTWKGKWIQSRYNLDNIVK